MATNYPGGLDSFTEPSTSDKQSTVLADGRDHRTRHVDEAAAIVAIETELGVNPSGSAATVAARFATVGDAVGPASATDNAVARFDGTTGKLLQSGPVAITDAGKITGLADGTASTDAATVGQLGGDEFAAPVLNGDFQAWPRGTSFAVATGGSGTLTAARWRAYSAGAGRTVSRQAGPAGTAYAARIARDSGNTATDLIILGQSMLTADAIRFAGEEITVSWTAKAGANFSAASSAMTVQVLTGTGTDEVGVGATYTGTRTALDSTHVITTTAARYSKTVTLNADTNEAAIRFGFVPGGTAGANDWVEISEVQIDFGATAMPYRPVPVAATAKACEWFVEKFGPYGAGELRFFGSGANTSSATNFATVLPYAPKRVAPTITISAVNDWTVHYQNTNAHTTNLTVGFATLAQCLLSATVSGGMTAGNSGLVSNNQDEANAYVLVEADI